MNPVAEDYWHRATEALRVAEHDLPLSPDAVASRAYYAAFYAVSAWFALKAREFSKHSTVEAAVHRELVKTGTFSAELGRGFSQLAQLRAHADYGGSRHVTAAEASDAILLARKILVEVSEAMGARKDPPSLGDPDGS